MSNIISKHTGIPFQQISIQDAVNSIKTHFEIAINNGTRINTIRTSSLIKYIHDAIKTEFYLTGIHPSLINPSKEHLLNSIKSAARTTTRAKKLTDKELKLAGFLKTKKQDISIIPDNLSISPQILSQNSMLNGYYDIYGDNFTESILSVNVRSQLSSVGKNFDTLYERTFAESLNLHQRIPKMVLGEVYLLPVKEYSDSSTPNNIIFNPVNIEKYINAFQAINGRTHQNDEKFKYERCCLLVVDFEPLTPIIYNTSNQLIQDGISTFSSLDSLNFSNFVSDLMGIYKTRFPSNTFN
jgi:hypothetical protein